MLLRAFSSGLDVSRLQSLREAIDSLAAAGAGSSLGRKLSVSRMHREPETDDETAFVREVVKTFWTSGIDRFYATTYQREPLLLLEHCTIRVQETRPDGNYVPWHLDASFYGFDVPMLTAWIPLVDVGTDAPGLEFADLGDRVAPAELQRLWLTAPLDERGRRALDDAQMDETFGTDIPRRDIKLKVGGFCVFDQTVLHRTQVMPDARSRRVALEYRIADRDTLPRDIPPKALKGMLMSWRDPQSSQVRIGYSGALFPAVAQA